MSCAGTRVDDAVMVAYADSWNYLIDLKGQ